MNGSYDRITRRTALKKGAMAGAVLVGGTAVTGTAAAGIGEGRVGHYPLNNIQPGGTVHDASTYDNDGMNKGASVIRDVGPVGNAFAFDGTDDYVNVSDDSSLDIQDEITISFWFYLDGKSGDNRYPRAVSKGQSNTRNGAYGVFIEDSGGDPTRIGLRFIDTNGRKHDIDTGNSLPNYNDGSWHHVAATYSDADDVGRLWFDGTKEVDKTISGDIRIRTTDDDLHLGDGKGRRHLNGKLDEVRIYDRALSEEEVQDLADMDDD